MTTSRLLELPRELRDQIYYELYVNSEQHCGSKNLSILQTCGQVYSEARIVAWESTAFVVRADSTNAATRFFELSEDLQRAINFVHAYVRQPLPSIPSRILQSLLNRIIKLDLDLQPDTDAPEFPAFLCGQEVMKAVYSMSSLKTIGVLFRSREDIADHTIEMLKGMLAERRSTTPSNEVEKPSNQYFGDPFTSLLVRLRYDVEERRIALRLLWRHNGRALYAQTRRKTRIADAASRSWIVEWLATKLQILRSSSSMV